MLIVANFFSFFNTGSSLYLQSRVLCDDSDCDSAELDQSGSGEPSRPPSAGAWLPPSQSYHGSAQVPPSGPP